MDKLILSQGQAAAIYAAMCALNNVSGRINIEVDGANVLEGCDGFISVFDEAANEQEIYPNQTAFAKAYSLT